jgi:hypothetical protein
LRWPPRRLTVKICRVTGSAGVAAIVIALAWLGQVPGPVELAGGAIALAGVMLAGSRPRRLQGRVKAAGVGEPVPVR